MLLIQLKSSYGIKGNWPGLDVTHFWKGIIKRCMSRETLSGNSTTFKWQIRVRFQSSGVSVLPRSFFPTPPPPSLDHRHSSSVLVSGSTCGLFTERTARERLWFAKSPEGVCTVPSAMFISYNSTILFWQWNTSFLLSFFVVSTSALTRVEIFHENIQEISENHNIRRKAMRVCQRSVRNRLKVRNDAVNPQNISSCRTKRFYSPHLYNWWRMCQLTETWCPLSTPSCRHLLVDTFLSVSHF